MLRSYNSSSRKQFEFGYISNYSTKLPNKDIKILNQIETEINNLVSRVQLLKLGYIDTTHLNLVINRRLSLIVKNILNHYDIGHFERAKWCGLRKYTVITFDKILPRIISNPPIDFSSPLEQLVSNAINIKIPSTNSIPPSKDTYKHDYLNPDNKAQARKLRGIYNA